MTTEYVDSVQPVAWRLHSADDEPTWFQTMPLDLSVASRHCHPEPEMPATGCGSTTSAFKKSILKRYSKLAVVRVQYTIAVKPLQRRIRKIYQIMNGNSVNIRPIINYCFVLTARCTKHCQFKLSARICTS